MTIDPAIMAKAAMVASTGVAVAGEQAVPRLPQNDGGEEEQERGLDQRRHALDLAMTVMVLLVGRLVGNADGKIGHGGRREIEQRMRRFREDRERAGRDPDDRLADGERRRRADRTERDTLLFATVIFAGCRHGGSIPAVATGVNLRTNYEGCYADGRYRESTAFMKSRDLRS